MKLQIIECLDYYYNNKSAIFIFGKIDEKDENGEYKTVTLITNDYDLEFYIKRPSWFKNTSKDSFLMDIINRYNEDNSSHKYHKDITLEDVEISLGHVYKNIRGYNKEFDEFIKFSFKKLNMMNRIKYYFKSIGERFKPIKININGRSNMFTPELFNSELNSLYHFFHVNDINSCGWLEVDVNTCYKNSGTYKRTKSNYEFYIENWKKSVKVINPGIFGNMKICSFDIECISDTGAFPVPENDKDYIIQIGMANCIYNKPELDKNYIVVLDTCDKFDEDTTVIVCKTEKELLLKWMRLMDETNPDILVGYNINGFDFNYIISRCEKYGIDKELYKYMSRLKEKGDKKFYKCKKYVKTAVSAGMGENKFITMDIPGRCIFDVSSYMRTFHHEKFDSYKLDHISEKLLGQKKDDVSPKQIFQFQKENSYKRGLIAKYCIQDCRLVNLLVQKLCIIENLFGMASTCYVNPNSLLIRGQSNKGFSLLSKKCMEYNYIIPFYKVNRDSNESYSGAFVLTAISGCHYFPVSCLDFSSLYPSCMISHNLCISSYLEEENIKEVPKEDQVVVNANIGFEDKDEKLHNFYKPKKLEDLGVIPKILIDLLNKRKECKKLMKKEKDQFKKNVLDGLQLAYKVTANSMYGLLGDRYSQFYKPQVAESVTATGRNMLIIAQDKVREHYPGSRIIYGDSITSDSPLLLKNKNTNNIEIKQIDELFNIDDNKSRYEGLKLKDTIESNRREKEKNTANNYQIWTSEGWSDIKYVIRHKCNKKIYGINTHTGYVNVTEDHSLMNENKEKIKPTDCNIGTKLFQKYLNEFNKNNDTFIEEIDLRNDINKYIWNDCNFYKCNKCEKYYNSKYYYWCEKYSKRNQKNYYKRELKCKLCRSNKNIFKLSNKILYKQQYKLTKDEAFVFGFFNRVGSCEKYNTKSGIKYTWTLNNNNLERLNNLKNILEKVEGFKFKILDTLKSSGVYKLVQFSENSKYMVEKYRKMFYNKDKYKIIPTCILNGNEEIKKSFLKGYYEADGSKTGQYNINKQLELTIKGQIGTAQFTYLLKSLGYNVNVCRYKTRHNIFRLRTFSYNRNELNAIKFMEDKTEHYKNQYVYDIEIVDKHHNFQGGIGDIIVFNTDSVFVSFKIKDHDKKCLFNKCNEEKRQKLYHKLKEKLIKKYGEDEYTINLKMLMFDNKKYKECECGEMEDLLSKEALQYSIDISLKAEKLIKEKYLQSPHGLIHPHNLEYEKTYLPYILLTKKRYIGYKYEFNTKDFKLDYKGLALKRRNYCKWVKMIYKEIVEKLLHKHDTNELFIYLKNILIDTLNNKYPVEDFKITKTIKSITSYKNIQVKEYKNVKGKTVSISSYNELQNDEDKRIIQSKSHIMLNELIRMKDPGEAYNINERIPYCFIVPKEKVRKGDLQYKFINTPKYIVQDDYNINYQMYIDKQLLKPLSDLFNLRDVKNEFVNYMKVFSKMSELKSNGYSNILELYE